MLRGKRWLQWVLAVAFVVLMAPLFAGALGAFPAADDFVYVTRTHQTWAHMHSLPHVLVDAWRYSVQIYHNWQGTLVGALVMSLNPAVFSLAGYGAHVWVLLLAYLGALYALLRTVCGTLGLARRVANVAFVCLAALQWVYIPDLLEGLYWFNSAWFYTLAHAGWMLMLALAIRLSDAATSHRKLGCAALWIVCAALGLDNYITAMLALCSLALLSLLCWRTRRRTMPLLIGLALLAVGLVISVMAPGNAVRLATETQHAKPSPWLLLAAWQSVTVAAQLWFRFLIGTPLLGLCVLSAPWLLQAMRGVVLRVRQPVLAAVLGIAAAFALLCAMIFPHMYSTGYAGPSRIINLYFFYCVIATLACLSLVLGVLARRVSVRSMEAAPTKHAAHSAQTTQPMQATQTSPTDRAAQTTQATQLAPLARRMITPLCAGIGVALIGLTMLTHPPTSYASLLRNLANGEIAAYRAQTMAQFDSLAAQPKGSDAVVVAGPHAPSPVAYVPFMRDPSHWANVAVADYFELHSVRLGDKAASK